MKLYFVEKFSEGDSDLQLEAMREFFTFTELKDADAIYCASIVQMHKALAAQAESQLPLVVYCWDYYKWAHEGKHKGGGDWPAYAAFLKKADLIIVPSEGQQLRLKELLKLDSVVVHSGIRQWDMPVSDGGFILDPLRYYHHDENFMWAEQAAAQLGIPIIHSEHGYNDEEFKKLLASCTFMTSCVREASTGGLSLMEGMWMGKMSLLSDSPYMGGFDYCGPFALYFKHDSFEDLVVQMKWMWENRPKVNLKEAREYMEENFSYRAMAKGLYENIHRII